MITPPVLVEQLRLQGFRITRLRKTLLQVLTQAPHPLSVQEMDELLRQQGVRVNKTTIYREVDFLQQRKIVNPIQFQEDLTRYELMRDHHHHLVCLNCRKIEDIKLQAFEDFFPELEKRLKSTQQFHLAHHSLELFGRCAACAE